MSVLKKFANKAGNAISTAANKVGDAIAKPVYQVGDAIAKATGLDKAPMPTVNSSSPGRIGKGLLKAAQSMKKSMQASGGNNTLNKIGDALATPYNAIEKAVYKAGDVIAENTGLDKVGINNPIAPIYDSAVKGVKDVVYGVGDTLAGDVGKGLSKIGGAVADVGLSPIKSVRDFGYDVGDTIAAKTGWDKGKPNTVEPVGPAPKKPEPAPAKTIDRNAPMPEKPQTPPGSRSAQPKEPLTQQQKTQIEWAVSNQTRDQYMQEQQELFRQGRITADQYNRNLDEYDALARRRG